MLQWQFSCGCLGGFWDLGNMDRILNMQRSKTHKKSRSVQKKALKSSRTGVCQSNDSNDFGLACTASLSKLASASITSCILDVAGSLFDLQDMTTIFFFLWFSSTPLGKWYFTP